MQIRWIGPQESLCAWLIGASHPRHTTRKTSRRISQRKLDEDTQTFRQPQHFVRIATHGSPTHPSILWPSIVTKNGNLQGGLEGAKSQKLVVALET